MFFKTDHSLSLILMEMNTCGLKSYNGCFCSVTQSCPTLYDPMDYSTPGFPVLHYLPEFAQFHVIELMMSSIHPSLCFPHLLLPSIFPSIRVFSNESALHIRWPKYWSFSFNISPSNEYSGFIAFRMDWLDLLAVQGTLKSLLQHHSSKASIVWCSAFFIVQLSHPHVTTGKTIALTRKWDLMQFLKRYSVVSWCLPGGPGNKEPTC